MALNFTDQQYDGRAMWSSTVTYALGVKLTYNGRLYESLMDNNLNQRPDTATTFWRDCGVAPEDGYYQHILLSEIITNFMASEVTEGMMLANTSQRLVEYHAQRAVQELTYDTLRTVKSFSYNLDGDLSVPLPQEAVGIVGVFWADDLGYKHPMTQRRFSGNPEQPLEDSDGNYMYDENGNRLNAQNSDLVTNFNSRQDSIGADEFYNYYAGSFENDELYDRYYSYYGRRFGSEPSQTNINGSYLFDEQAGVVFIDTNYSNATIVIDYVSDGLGDDVSMIRVHKFSEEAIYMYIKWKLVSSKMGMPLYEKQLAKKEYAACKRRAKHRLSTLQGIDIFQAMLNKQKWIKR